MRLGVLLLLLPTMSTTQETFGERLDAFNVPYNAFYRSYHGCPAGTTVAAECKPRYGVIDRREYGRARSAAMKLFELKEAI